MNKQDTHVQVSDAVIVSAGYITKDSVAIYTADKTDAEYLYNVVGEISDSRNLEETEAEGLHREYYIQLAESDEHSIENEDAFDWNTRKIWMVTFEPSDFFQQRTLHWADDDNRLQAPSDFNITPLIARVIYFTGAHEMAGASGPYIEFIARDEQKLDAELQNLDIHTTKVNNMWHLDEENSKKFREYADLPEPNYNGGDNTNEAD